MEVGKLILGKAEEFPDIWLPHALKTLQNCTVCILPTHFTTLTKSPSNYRFIGVNKHLLFRMHCL